LALWTAFAPLAARRQTRSSYFFSMLEMLLRTRMVGEARRSSCSSELK